MSSALATVRSYVHDGVLTIQANDTCINVPFRAVDASHWIEMITSETGAFRCEYTSAGGIGCLTISTDTSCISFTNERPVQSQHTDALGGMSSDTNEVQHLTLTGKYAPKMIEAITNAVHAAAHPNVWARCCNHQ